MQKNLIESFFKPFKLEKKSFLDFLDDKAKRNFLKHRIWFECSKSKDESCINNECKHNFVNVHDNELYIDLLQEIKNDKNWND